MSLLSMLAWDFADDLLSDLARVYDRDADMSRWLLKFRWNLFLLSPMCEAAVDHLDRVAARKSA